MDSAALRTPHSARFSSARLASRTVQIKLTEAIFVFPGWLCLADLGFALVVTTSAAIYPARRGATIDPVIAFDTNDRGVAGRGARERAGPTKALDRATDESPAFQRVARFPRIGWAAG